MQDVPECLNNRYKILDNLMKDLDKHKDHDDTSALTLSKTPSPTPSSNHVAIKLMCDLWKILKENPDCDLSELIRERIGLKSASSGFFMPQKYQCYMAETPRNMEGANSREIFDKVKSACCSQQQQRPQEQKPKCCSSKSVSPSVGSDGLPLSKVLCNLKEAASFDRKCKARLNQLLETEKRLTNQIQHLEHREKEGVTLLKQADCMWTCMEDAYKKKIAECMDRHKDIAAKLNDIEKSASKWRKNKKDLESQMDSIYKCKNEIQEKINQKNNDLKFTNAEIESFKKKIETVKVETTKVKKSFDLKKQAADQKIQNLTKQINKATKDTDAEKYEKRKSEERGDELIRDVRNDLINVGRVLLKKQIEAQDLKSEIEGVHQEIDMLRESLDTCKSKCKTKKDSISEELSKVSKEIGAFKVKCIQCHQCNDTQDVRKFCIDCPRCARIRDCLYDKDKCYLDHAEDCICTIIKQRFFDNIFENMSTVLERQVRTDCGKAIGDSILECLKKSTNGKLDSPTRRLLQEFIVTTIRKNLNLTIVGGAIKTRCEMDPDMYKKLMLCLKEAKVTPISKAEKAIAAKKESCRRWGGTNECNCPKGPKDCVCSRKGPKPSRTPRSSPPTPPDKDDAAEAMACPHKDGKSCGLDCAARASENVPSKSSGPPWKPSPCKPKSCPYSKNMRAAQCAVGSDAMVKGTSLTLSSEDQFSNLDSIDDIEKLCICGNDVNPSCLYHGGAKQMKVEFVDDNLVATTHRINDINYFKVKAKVGNDYIPDVVSIIKLTSSGNFDVIWNKEFEKIYEDKIQNFIDKENVRCISLCKTQSQSYFIDIQKAPVGDATLIKLFNGGVKIMTNKDEQIKDRPMGINNVITNKELAQHNKKTETGISTPIINNISIHHGLSKSHSEIVEQIKKLDKGTFINNIIYEVSNNVVTNKEVKQHNTKTQTSVSAPIVNNVSIQHDLSNSNLEIVEKKIKKLDKGIFINNINESISPRKIKIVIKDYKQDDIEIVGTMRRISGCYIIQFDDVSSIKLTRLKTFLSVYKQCYIPININDPRDTVVLLLDTNKKCSSKEVYALLKVTMANDIVLVIDEYILDGKGQLSTKSYHLIQQIEDPRNASVNTSCNAKNSISEINFCIKDKCVCSQLPETIKRNWFPTQRTNLFHCQKQSIYYNWESRNPAMNYKANNFVFFNMKSNRLVENVMYANCSYDGHKYCNTRYYSMRKDNAKVENTGRSMMINDFSGIFNLNYLRAFTEPDISDKDIDLDKDITSCDTTNDFPLQLPYCLRQNYLYFNEV